MLIICISKAFDTTWTVKNVPLTCYNTSLRSFTFLCNFFFLIFPLTFCGHSALGQADKLPKLYPVFVCERPFHRNLRLSRPHECQTCTRSDTFSTWRFPPFFWHFLIEPSEAGVTLRRSLPLVWLFITGFQTAKRCKINWLCLKSNYFQVIASQFTHWKEEG